MEDTAKTVQELKILIRELILEIGDLKERVTRLERAEIAEPLYEERRANVDLIKLQGEGYERLGQLYNDGFHVCPSNFGDGRQEECLFCMAFMQKE